MIYIVIFDYEDIDTYKLESVWFCATLETAMSVGIGLARGDGWPGEWVKEGPAYWSLDNTNVVIQGQDLEPEPPQDKDEES